MRRCQKRLIHNQGRGDSLAKVGRAQREGLRDRSFQKQSLHFDEDEKILFAEREIKNTKGWGIRNLCQESVQEFKRSQPQLESLLGRHVRFKSLCQTPEEQERPAGSVLLLFGFAFFAEISVVAEVFCEVRFGTKYCSYLNKQGRLCPLVRRQ